MNLSFKAENGKIFEVPFTYELLKDEQTYAEGSTIQFFKLILNTMLTDLPFQKIIYTLPHVEDFLKLLPCPNNVADVKLEMTLGIPKLIIHTLEGDHIVQTTTFHTMTNQYIIGPTHYEQLPTLQRHFKQIFITTDPYTIPDFLLYRETNKAFRNLMQQQLV